MAEEKRRHGARLDDNGHTHFALWAPDAKSVAVKLQDDTQHAMTASDDGWYAATLPVTAGTDYHYLIDEHLLVPDPASRWQANDVHGPSRVADSSRYQWRSVGWQGRPWQETVLYEVHVGTLGGYQAAQARLQELADLGVTAIELMPLGEFPGGRNWGYDGVLPFAPDSSYGTPDQLRALIDHAHELGLMVFIDVVYNHFGPDGNYLPLYAPQFFSSTHESPWGRAINFDQDGCEVVREFFIHNALYWIEEFRVDGLRLDAVHAILDDGPAHILQDISQRVRALAQSEGREVHLVLENEKNQASWLQGPAVAGRYDGQWNDDFHHALHVLLTGESHTYYGRFASHPMDLLARVLTEGFAFPEGVTPSGAVPAVPLPTLLHFIGNHDQIGNRAFGERLAALAPTEAVELALLLSLLTPATPMVFMGDEFGATTPFLYFADWEGELREAVRAGRMREFSHAVPEGRALPDPCNADTVEASRLDWVQSELAPARQRSDLVRQALEARRQWFVPSSGLLDTGRHTSERIGERGLRVQWAYADGSACWLEANLGPDPVENGPPRPAGELLFQHRWLDDGESGSAAWGPWSARWICTPAAH